MRTRIIILSCLALACAGVLVAKKAEGWSGARASPGAVVVNPPMINSFFASPNVITNGNSSNLSWSVSGVTTSVSINQGVGAVSQSGSRTVSPGGNLTYTLTATNGSGSVTAQASITVTGSPSLIADARITTWQPGVTYNGGIPVRTVQCNSLNPIGGGTDDTAAIQTAINTCPAGQVVKLNPGTFTVAEGQYILLNKAITLRGSGATSTFITRTGGATTDSYQPGSSPTPAIILGPARYNQSGDGSTAITADASKGAFTVAVADTSHLSVGQIIILDELSAASFVTDPAGRGQVCASSDMLVVYQKHNPSQGFDDPVTCTGSPLSGDAVSWFFRTDRPVNEIKRISAISGNNVTFETPFHHTYRLSQIGQVYYFAYTQVSNAGVESLSVANADDGGIRINWCDSCWVKSVEVKNWLGEGIAISNSYRSEIRESYIHDTAWPQPGGGGYAISWQNASSESLVENNIIMRNNKMMVARGAGTASVVAYNYADDGFINTNGNWQEVGLNGSHMVGSHHMLFEGNESFNNDSDKTHGNATAHTFYRNHLRCFRKRFTDPHTPCPGNCGNPISGSDFDDINQQSQNGPLRCAGAGYYSVYMNWVGNVMGLPGQMGNFSLNGNFSGGVKGIWLLGWDDFSPYPTDANVASTAFRHGNYNYLENAITWDGSNSNHALKDSYYTVTKPAFFNDGSGYVWPPFDPTTTPATINTLPAKVRSDNNTPFTQP